MTLFLPAGSANAQLERGEGAACEGGAASGGGAENNPLVRDVKVEVWPTQRHAFDVSLRSEQDGTCCRLHARPAVRSPPLPLQEAPTSRKQSQPQSPNLLPDLFLKKKPQINTTVLFGGFFKINVRRHAFVGGKSRRGSICRWTTRRP